MTLLAHEALDTGYRTCQMKFTGSKYDIAQSSANTDLPSKSIRSARDFRKHVRRDNSQLMIVQSPYPGHYPTFFAEEIVNVPTGYFGYGLALSKNAAAHFGAELLYSCDYIGAASQYELDGYQEHLPQAQSLLTGSPLIYELRRAMNSSQLQIGTHHLLWAPHWSREWMEDVDGFSRWTETVSHLHSWMSTHPEVNLTIRPHPYLRDSMEAHLQGNTPTGNPNTDLSIDSQRDAEAIRWLKKLITLPNVHFSNTTLLADISSNDALITDGISILGYWAVTGKPLLLIRDSTSPSLNLIGEAIAAQTDVSTGDNQITRWLDSWIKNALSNGLDRIAIAQELLPTYEKHPFELLMGFVGDTDRRVRRSNRLRQQLPWSFR